MSEPTLYVTYYVAPQTKFGANRREHANPQSTGASQPNEAIQDFRNRHPHAEIIDSYTEIPENRRTAKWPELQKALALCRQRNASLLIIELGTLANNDSFSQILLNAAIPFQCFDQPFVNQTILEALSKHAEVQRKLHGKLIREGLKLTSAKSGNPKAAEVIGRVNKPKIDTAIVFAFLLDPIIQDYRRKGYSQRQMVKTLNEEGFTAPEGGKWVLSQLQKVLDRVRLNEIATELKTHVDTLPLLSTPEDIAELFNSKAIPPLKQPLWDESQVKKLCDRVEQIKDITFINGFVLNLLPLLHEYRNQRLSPVTMLMELQQAGLPIKQHGLPSHAEKHNQDQHHPIHKLRILISSLPNNTGCLEVAFESAAKHMPVYLKIVKGHIEQLAKVLGLETHNHRNLENAGLAEPVIQLMHLFRELNSEDIQLIETLAEEARNWQSEQSSDLLVPENAENLVQEA